MTALCAAFSAGTLQTASASVSPAGAASVSGGTASIFQAGAASAFPAGPGNFGSGAGGQAAQKTGNASVPTADGEKIRAVTYSGHEWVINFWSTETEYLEADLEQIKKDGFNTIILCVPWRQFQPSVHSRTFNETAFEKLRGILKTAGEQDVSVMLRLGYTWDYYDDSDLPARYQQLIYDGSYQTAWKQYAQKIYETVSGYDSYIGAFLTWEDFWNFVSSEEALAGTYNGKRLAKEMGFTDYVLEHYDREERLLLYGDASLADAPEFPKKDSPAYRFFLDWYDSWLNELLSETQEVFPNLSMECRLDQDPYLLPQEGGISGVKEEAAQLAGYSHGQTFPCAGAGYSSLMLSAGMGYESGSKISAAEAAGMGRQLLQQSRAMAQKPIFADQFLYMETTPGYEDLAGLPETEMNDYLAKMGDVFNEQTIGYGIWTYRDYADNIVNNPEFGQALSGWSVSPSVHTETYKGSEMAALGNGMSISQSLSGRSFLGTGTAKLRFRAVSEKPVQLSLSVGGVTKNVTVSGDETVSAEFPSETADSLRIMAFGDVLIDSVKLYTHVTEGGIYGLDGKEGPYLSGIRACNEKIK